MIIIYSNVWFINACFSGNPFYAQIARRPRNTGYFLLTVMILFSATAQGAFEYVPYSARSIAMGGIVFDNLGGPLNGFADPASVIVPGKAELAWTHGHPYGLNSLNNWAVALRTRINETGVSLGGAGFGNELYSETLMAFMFCKTIMDRFTVGLSMIGYQLEISNYGSVATMGLTVAGHYRMNDQLLVATALRNINGPVLGSTREVLPQVVTTGLILEIPGNNLVQLEWEQDLEYNGRLKAGVALSPVKWGKLFAGYSSSPGIVSVGVGFNWLLFRLEYGAAYYGQLGRLDQKIEFRISLDRN